MFGNKSMILIVVALIAVSAIVLGLSLRRSNSQSVQISPADPQTIRYLPLGDSYTIGQSVAEAERWPNQLAEAYKPAGKSLRIVANPAVTGYTSQDLIDKELPLVKQLKPDFVTVLIGVNDYVQGVPEAVFRTNLQAIIASLQSDMARPQNILLVTIPDYAKTPGGARFGDPAAASISIENFNRIIVDAAQNANLPHADIFAVSQRVVNEPALTASDGLHPSGRQYQAWTAIIQQRLQEAGIPR